CPKFEKNKTFFNVEKCYCIHRYERNRETGYCEPCAVGYYKGYIGDFRCNKCPENTTTRRTGSFHKMECRCEIGFEKKGNQTSCKTCEIGYYKNSIELLDCLQCPQNTTTTERGTTSLSDCVCKPGYFRNAEENCILCEPNSINSDE
ncbi:MAG: hypothetical protein MHPSP_001833, partial [Paramarteilia canceri]